MKYIIDVPDDIYQIVLMDGIGQTRSFYRKIDLTPYTDIDTKELVEEFGRGYDAGWDAGSKFHKKERESIEDEVWDFVKAIEMMSIGEVMKVFDVPSEKIPFLCSSMSYQEAKNRFKLWQKKNEIKVGDEVTYTSCGDTVTFIVLGKKKNKYYGFIPNAPDYDDVGEYCDADMLKKTGRHFPEIVELLEKVKDDEE